MSRPAVYLSSRKQSRLSLFINVQFYVGVICNESWFRRKKKHFDKEWYVSESSDMLWRSQ